MTKVGEHITLDIIGTTQEYDPSVYERVIKGENKTAYIKTIGYPSNFGNALKCVAREILNEEGKTYTLKEYVKRWESVENSLTSIIE